MPSVSYGIGFSGGGTAISKSVVRTADTVKSYQVTLPAGTAGSLTLRTDDDTGEVTATGHGFSGGEIVDVYWDGGVQYGCTVGIVAGDVVPIDTGSGDVLPAQSTAVVIVEQVIINTQIDGDNVSILGVSLESNDSASTSKGHVDFQDSGDATIEEVDLVANEPRVYDITGGDTNVFTGNPITHAQVSNGSSSESLTLKIVSLEDSTP